MNYFVFVYGTLRKKLAWHHLLKNSKFIGNAITKEKYTLYADTIPYLIEEEKTIEVIGELYEVNESTLAVLDHLEGHPNWYCRKQAKVLIGEKEVTAWIYFFPKAVGQLISSGDFTKRN